MLLLHLLHLQLLLLRPLAAAVDLPPSSAAIVAATRCSTPFWSNSHTTCVASMTPCDCRSNALHNHVK